MKKFLSLVLALVMTMSLVTIGAGAKDFTDGDNVTYEEAVAVMSEVKVLDGYTDGSFKPQGELTRGAAAKIICNLILGPTTAAELHADTAPYKDVAIDHTFAGYIAYCAKEGIVSGYADGTFRPAAPLTGYAFMKMLLGALGYDQDTEGYTGTNWSINVAKQAIGIGLNKGLKTDFNGIKTVTREEAALYAFNTLKATMVEYDEKTTINVGGAQVTLAGKAQDVAWGTATLNDGNIKKDGFVQFAEKHFPKLVRKDDSDAFGRPTNAWSNNKKDIGAYLNYDLLVAEYTTEVEGGEVYSDIGSVAADFDLTYFVDGEKLSKDATKTQASYIAKKNDDTMSNSGNGVLTQVFVDTDAEELTITEINTYLAKTDDYNEKKETLKLDEIYGYGYGKYNDAEVLELEDFPSIKDYSDGDMVLVTIANGEVQTIVDAEIVKGVEIDEFSKHDYVKADQQYDYAETGALAGSYGYTVLSDYDKNGGNLDEKTFNLYLDQYGYLIGIKQVEADVEYVFITAYDKPVSHLTNKTAEANAIFSDGTMDVINVNVTKSKFATGNVWGTDENGDEVENTWYSYSEKNGVYTLTYVTNQFHDTAVTKIDSKNISQYDTADQLYYYGNADTNYIVVGVGEVNGKAVIDEVASVTAGVKNVSIKTLSDDEIKADAKTTTADSKGVYTVHKTSGAYIIASIVVGDDGTVNDRYAYLFGEPKNEKYSKADDAYYWDMKAVIDGAETVVTFKTELPAQDAFTENLYKLSYDKDGYAVKAEVATHSRTGSDYQWVDEFNPNNTKLIKTAFGTQNQPAANLTAKGETLWIEQQSIKRGFALADECPAVIIEQNADGEAKKIVEYSTVEKAIKALDNYDVDTAKNFDGTIIMTVKDGLVTSVILTDTVTSTDPNRKPVDGSTKYEVVDVDEVTRTLYLDKEDNVGDFDKAEAVKAAQKALYDMGWELTENKLDETTSPWSVKAVNMNTSNAAVLNWYIDWEK